MGLWMSNIDYLSHGGLLPADSARVLDIGSQNLYFATPDAIRGFVVKHGSAKDDASLSREAERIAYFSTPRPGERTSFVSELFDLTTSIRYTSFDVCPALRTEIVDLNIDACPPHFRGVFDLALNFGTTEHIFNQLNVFRVMHDALRVGGVGVHQVPSIGWIGHGYFSYQPTFFDDLIAANGYAMIDRWLNRWSETTADPEIDVRDPWTPSRPGQDATTLGAFRNYNLNVIYRKLVDAPFRIKLELATSHAAVAPEIAALYRNAGISPPPPEQKTRG